MRSEGKEYVVQEGDVMLFRYTHYAQYTAALLVLQYCGAY
jgi:Protein of unknown function (DUF933)